MYIKQYNKLGEFLGTYKRQLNENTWESGIRNLPENAEIDEGEKPTSAQKLAILKSEKLVEIDNKSKSLIYKGFEHNANQFSMSDQAQTNYLGLSVKKESLTFPYKLTTLDDSEYSVADVAELEAIIDKAFIHKEAILASGRSLKVSAKSASTQTALKNILDKR